MRTFTESSFEEMVWRKPGQKPITFDGVWRRQPQMTETVKVYCRRLLEGKYGRCRAWGTVRDYKDMLGYVAVLLEENGKTSFADLTSEMLMRWWKGGARTQRRRATIETTCRLLLGSDLPHLHGRHRNTLTMTDFLVTDEITQTEPLDDAWWNAIMKRALAYEEEAHRLADWLQERDWNDPWIQKKGIRHERALKGYIWRLRMAGVVLVLGFTGMRRSELCALRSGALECVQQGKPVWVIWSTVFKFHREGERARWACGEVGRRGYAILDALAEDSGRCFPTSFYAKLDQKLNAWLAVHEWKEGCPPTIHAHQFRRTLARYLLVTGNVTLLAIKEQFKHKTTVMTDYYVGTDANLQATCLAKQPLLAMSLTDLIQEIDDDE